MTLERPQAVLFDWDNTLVDTWQCIHRALEAAFVAMGQQPWTLDQTRQRVRRSAREAFPEMFGERADEAAEVFYATFEADHLVNLRERSGAASLLRQLSQCEDVLLGVVSNKRGNLLRQEAEHLGWNRYFFSIVGANDAEKDKPDPAAVKFALDGSGVTAGSAVWFVGDTDIDMLCAANCGCVPILIRETAPAPEEFGTATPQAYFQSCSELAEAIRFL